MELKEGMYVRIVKGIGKIDKIENFMRSLKFHLDSNKGTVHNVSDNSYWNYTRDIIGYPSDNPIDLIEVGDYVNGKEVTEVMRDEEGNVTDIVYTEEVEGQSYSLLPIKNIVTKEQFNYAKYEVE